VLKEGKGSKPTVESKKAREKEEKSAGGQLTPQLLEAAGGEGIRPALPLPGMKKRRGGGKEAG